MVKVWRPHYQESTEVKNMEKNTVNHSAHSTWRCQYHIVFAPKFRQKVIYGQLKADIGYILRKLCEEKKVEIIEAEACADHIHMLVSIPPHLSVAQFMGYLKGKSTLIDLRSSCESKVQVWQSSFLVPWLLCRHGRKE